MERRPTCRRCKKRMDFSHMGGMDGNGITWECFRRPTSDEEFWERWNNLDGDDVVKLERQLEAMGCL